MQTLCVRPLGVGGEQLREGPGPGWIRFPGPRGWVGEEGLGEKRCLMVVPKVLYYYEKVDYHLVLVLWKTEKVKKDVFCHSRSGLESLRGGVGG